MSGSELCEAVNPKAKAPTDGIQTDYAKELAMTMIAQNNLVLSALTQPRKIIQSPGYYEDPHGQTIYVDEMGDVHQLHSPHDINGWTV